MATVLVVDDHDSVRQLVSRSHDVLEARDGAEALAILAHSSVDVVVLDLEMPEYTGLEVCQKIRADERLSTIGVIILTGSATDANQRVDGVDAILRKPSGVRLVSSAIDALIQRALLPTVPS